MESCSSKSNYNLLNDSLQEMEQFNTLNKSMTRNQSEIFGSNSKNDSQYPSTKKTFGPWRKHAGFFGNFKYESNNILSSKGNIKNQLSTLQSSIFDKSNDVDMQNHDESQKSVIEEKKKLLEKVNEQRKPRINEDGEFFYGWKNTNKLNFFEKNSYYINQVVPKKLNFQKYTNGFSKNFLTSKNYNMFKTSIKD